MRPGEIICHADAAPWNAVYREGAPIAFIDFDSARPDTPLLDLATSAWHFVPLAEDGDRGRPRVQRALVPARGSRRSWTRTAWSDRSRFLHALQRVKLRETTYRLFWRLGPAATAGESRPPRRGPAPLAGNGSAGDRARHHISAPPPGVRPRQAG